MMPSAPVLVLEKGPSLMVFSKGRTLPCLFILIIVLMVMKATIVTRNIPVQICEVVMILSREEPFR